MAGETRPPCNPPATLAKRNKAKEFGHQNPPYRPGWRDLAYRKGNPIVTDRLTYEPNFQDRYRRDGCVSIWGRGKGTVSTARPQVGRADGAAGRVPPTRETRRRELNWITSQVAAHRWLWRSDGAGGVAGGMRIRSFTASNRGDKNRCAPAQTLMDYGQVGPW